MSGIVGTWVCPDTRSVPGGLSRAWDEISAQHADERAVAGSHGNRPRGSADDQHGSGSGHDGAPSSVDAAQLTSCVTQAWPIVQATSTSAVRASIEPFLTSLTRRRDRDLDRVHQYYREIHNELARKAARHQGDVRAREEARLQATVQAWEARVEEVVARYRTRVTLTPCAATICRPAEVVDVAHPDHGARLTYVRLVRACAAAPADRHARRHVALRQSWTHDRAPGMRSLPSAHPLGLFVRRPGTLSLRRLSRAVRRVWQVVLPRLPHVLWAVPQDANVTTTPGRDVKSRLPPASRCRQASPLEASSRSRPTTTGSCSR